ncbi:hypothetical protein OH492_04030 [Vibrio chagasii]|nr:hypothetical protein [Vibrio chagasii]
MIELPTRLLGGFAEYAVDHPPRPGGTFGSILRVSFPGPEEALPFEGLLPLQGYGLKLKMGCFLAPVVISSFEKSKIMLMILSRLFAERSMVRR